MAQRAHTHAAPPRALTSYAALAALAANELTLLSHAMAFVAVGDLADRSSVAGVHDAAATPHPGPRTLLAGCALLGVAGGALLYTEAPRHDRHYDRHHDRHHGRAYFAPHVMWLFLAAYVLPSLVEGRAAAVNAALALVVLPNVLLHPSETVLTVQTGACSAAAALAALLCLCFNNGDFHAAEHPGTWYLWLQSPAPATPAAYHGAVAAVCAATLLAATVLGNGAARLAQSALAPIAVTLAVAVLVALWPLKFVLPSSTGGAFVVLLHVAQFSALTATNTSLLALNVNGERDTQRKRRYCLLSAAPVALSLISQDGAHTLVWDTALYAALGVLAAAALALLPDQHAPAPPSKKPPQVHAEPTAPKDSVLKCRLSISGASYPAPFTGRPLATTSRRT